jgi:antitoxin component of MazEF toxin-antitoxin module
MKALGRLYNNGGSLAMTIDSDVVNAMALKEGEYIQYEILEVIKAKK